MLTSSATLASGVVCSIGAWDLEDQPMAEFLKVAKADELSPGQARRVDVHGKRLALFNIDGNFYALEDTCTHKDGPLSRGTVAGDQVTCAWHGAKFNIRTGEVRPSRAPRHRPLQRSADGDRYRDSGLAKAVECDPAEG
ncbi:MAG: non-heme iron oxygenase ferredoxin subunit [Gammaproteobacteria bacterium]|nr:MAG: non-heme iron oxygenase ferredoxin subunit [Gammaproteobacteria bacterium]